MKSRCLLMLTIWVAIFASRTSSADIIALESFNYNFGVSLDQVSGLGTGFSTNWIAGGRNYDLDELSDSPE
jgi:hypothetical protein